MIISDGVTSVTVDDVTAGRLERDLQTKIIAGGSGVTVVQPAWAAPLTGVLDILMPDLATALALDALVRAATVVIDAPGHPLDGLQFRAVTRLRIASERARPGRPARWTAGVPFVEVP